MADESQSIDFQPTGSVYIGNHSYSGADIKVLINIYDGGKSFDEQAFLLYNDINKLNKKLSHDISYASFVSAKLATMNSNTPEYSRIYNKWLNANNSSEATQKNILQAQNRITQIEQDKPKMSNKVLANVQTLSLSVFREKHEVRACGSVYSKGMTRGPRTVAGSLIFTVFNESVLHEFLEAAACDFDANRATSAILDQLPPVDISIMFANEYGALSRMHIYGVEFMQEGMTLSIEDILTEHTVSFIARDFDPMRSVANARMDLQSGQIVSELGKRASSLLLEEDYREMKDRLSPYSRFSRRRNPFI